MAMGSISDNLGIPEKAPPEVADGVGTAVGCRCCCGVQIFTPIPLWECLGGVTSTCHSKERQPRTKVYVIGNKLYCL